MLSSKRRTAGASDRGGSRWAIGQPDRILLGGIYGNYTLVPMQRAGYVCPPATLHYQRATRDRCQCPSEALEANTVCGYLGSSAMSSHDTTTFEIPSDLDSAKCELLSICPTDPSETRVSLPLPEAISTPFLEHQPKVLRLGWAASGLPQPAGWTSRGGTTPMAAQGTEWPWVAPIDGVTTATLTPIVATARTTGRNMATPNYGTASSST